MENQLDMRTGEECAQPDPSLKDVGAESALDILNGDNKPGHDENKQSAGAAAPEMEIESQEDSDGFTAEERRMYPNTIDYGMMYEAAKARRARQKQEKRLRAWTSSEAARLLKRLGQAYLDYQSCVERDPNAAGAALEFDEGNQRIFELLADRMRRSVEKAQNAPRCARIMAGGRRCRAPRVRGQKYCHMHQAMEEARPQKIRLPSLDDANGIQLAIAKSAQALVDGQLDQKQASLLACYLRLAATNVGRLDFEKQEDEQ